MRPSRKLRLAFGAVKETAPNTLRQCSCLIAVVSAGTTSNRSPTMP